MSELQRSFERKLPRGELTPEFYDRMVKLAKEGKPSVYSVDQWKELAKKARERH